MNTKKMNQKHARMQLRSVKINNFVEGPFDNHAEVYILSIVTDGEQSDPVKVSIETYKNIRRKDSLLLGPSGVTLYRSASESLPQFLDYRLYVMESDQAARDIGSLLEQIRSDPKFGEATAQIAAATGISGVAAPIVAPAIDLIIGVVQRILQMNKDDQLLFTAGTYSRTFDELGAKYGEVYQSNRLASVSYEVQIA